MTLREDIIAKIEHMDEDALKALLRYVDIMLNENLPSEYNPAKDPMLTGELLFSGPSDLAERSEEILHNEFGIKNESADKRA